MFLRAKVVEAVYRRPLPGYDNPTANRLWGSNEGFCRDSMLAYGILCVWVFVILLAVWTEISIF